MTYNIECPDFKKAATTSSIFAKNYAKNENRVITKNGDIEVVVDTHRFIFFYKGTKPNPISLADFLRHYFPDSAKKS